MKANGIVDEGACDLVVGVGVVVDHPGREGDRGVEQGVADRLRPGGHLDEVAVSRLPEGRDLRGSGASTSRSYWEAYGPDAPAAGSQPLPPPPIPVGFTTFPGEIWRTPRSWVEASYPAVIYFHAVDKGGHFAAWEEPELFTSEIRNAFRSLR